MTKSNKKIQQITRFAPSPTGFLHLGHVISLCYVFGIAFTEGAKVLLRIEDHDTERCRKQYEQAILDDMAWLGFIPDNWSDFCGRQKVTTYRQSDCFEIYADELRRLKDQSRTYACSCSRKILAGSRIDGDEQYPGICFPKKLNEVPGRGIRFRLEDANESFKDMFHGSLTQDPKKQCGDFLLKDRRGCFTYHFAVVVDDSRHGVDLVIRGKDLLSSTGRQLALKRALGYEGNIRYFHHPLILDPDGKKLSKRSLAEGIIKRREGGDCPERVIGEALFAAGLTSRNMCIKVSDLEKIMHDQVYINP